MSGSGKRAITHLLCVLAGVGLAKASDRLFNGPERVSTAYSVSGAAPVHAPAAAAPKPCDSPEVYYDVSAVVVPEGITLTGDPPQDFQDKMALKISVGFGDRLRQASDNVRWYILDRENEFCCLKCGEVNPSTQKKGYPTDCCHKCAGRIIRERVEVEHAPGDLNYLPEGTPISKVKTSR